MTVVCTIICGCGGFLSLSLAEALLWSRPPAEPPTGSAPHPVVRGWLLKERSNLSENAAMAAPHRALHRFHTLQANREPHHHTHSPLLSVSCLISSSLAVPQSLRLLPVRNSSSPHLGSAWNHLSSLSLPVSDSPEPREALLILGPNFWLVVCTWVIIKITSPEDSKLL